MKLYLHIGTNKTGSSSLQYFFQKNRLNLLNHDVYYPESKWDTKIEEGKISPGNGYMLATIILNGSQVDLQDYLSKLITETRQRAVNKILLSNEVLIRILSDKNNLDKLNYALKDCNFEQVILVCYIRNYYDHALSLFKHRNKSGKYLDYDNWLVHDYETLRLLSDFICFYRSVSQINWVFREYMKDGLSCVQDFTSNVLGLEIPNSSSVAKVNMGLSMSMLLCTAFVYPWIKLNSIVLNDIFLKSGFRIDYDNENRLKCFFFSRYQCLLSQRTDIINWTKLVFGEDTNLIKSPMLLENVSDCRIAVLAHHQTNLNRVLALKNRIFLLNILLNGYRKVKRIFFKRSFLHSGISFDKEKYGGSM